MGVGDAILRNISSKEIICFYLDIGTKLGMWVGTVFLQNYIYALRLPDGHLVKIVRGPLLGSAASKLFLLLIPVAILSSVLPYGGWIWFGTAAYLGHRSLRTFREYASTV